MKEHADGRGSMPQRKIFSQVKELYKDYKVIYELYIPELRQRFDIFVLELGIAVEYDGDQHDSFNEYFHRDINGYIESKKLDISKEKFCQDNGIKLIRIKGSVDELTKNNLMTIINKVDYPDREFCVDIFDHKSDKLEKEKEYRKQRYLRNKEK